MQQHQCISKCCCKADHRSQRREPILRQLHWLPVRWRVEFKIASLVYQVLASKVPTYLADDIHLASESSARSLRSSSGRKCSVTRVHSCFGDRCFTAAGPRIWNNLPASLWDREVTAQNSEDNWKLDVSDGPRCIVNFWLLRLTNTLIYLLTYLLTTSASCVFVYVTSKTWVYCDSCMFVTVVIVRTMPVSTLRSISITCSTSPARPISW